MNEPTVSSYPPNFDADVAPQRRGNMVILPLEPCGLIDRMDALGLPLKSVFAGVFTRVESGDAEVVYDPYAMSGFILRARAKTRYGDLDIGFDTQGGVVRSLLSFNVIPADEAMTLWLIAARN